MIQSESTVRDLRTYLRWTEGFVICKVWHKVSYCTVLYGINLTADDKTPPLLLNLCKYQL